ncbi:MAG TPA: hypothetical protein VGH80_05620 [Xanthomonadaceae bacterium]|jgi:hypothetical protein
MNLLQLALEDEALLALRRTLWQLAVVGVAAAIAIERLAPDAGLVALWCVLVPLSALAVHFRSELLRRWTAQRQDDAPRARLRRGGRQRVEGRRRSAMATRRGRSTELAGAR